ncbi:reverse transcriptase family protein [Pseudomonas coronafaciens]|uniref:reverse transcriptase family protein n=1 Tax=Pseudomonas coronafaciens TaxID=53409 RepID=UPI000AB299E9|nr:reverse transcriptase family protein [Pseudomonas coronafaciens]
MSLLLGIEYLTIQAMINGTPRFYRAFTIKKRAGGNRTIHAPYPSLLQCQDWIYKNILLNCPVHENAHGYVPKRSIFTNATPHLNCNVLLKMDLKDFFPSIGIGWVINLFSGLGYSNRVSYALASLCCNEGCLVQGASTSPYLTNILLHDLDERLNRLAIKNHLKYTRYADDMTFSGGYISSKLPKLIESIASDYGLSVNEEKTRLMINKNKKIVTGLSVSGDTLRITRDLRRTIKQSVHYIERYGFLSHVSQEKIKDPFYLDSIFGKVNFWLQAEPDNSDAKMCRDILLPHFGKDYKV